VRLIDRAIGPMYGRRVRARKLAVAAIMLALIALTPAAADAKRIKTRVVFNPFGFIEPSGEVTYFFSGSVVSKTRKFNYSWKCDKQRKVRVFRDEPAGDDTLIGSGRSDFLGSFVAARLTDLDAVPGDYYAKVANKKAKTNSRKLLCRGDRSPTVTVHPPDVD
jgi:hypothetical protein